MKFTRADMYRMAKYVKEMQKAGIFDVEVAFNKDVFMRANAFIEIFGDDYIVTERGCEGYSYELSQEVDGVKFHTITNDKKLAKVEKTAV